MAHTGRDGTKTSRQAGEQSCGAIEDCETIGCPVLLERQRTTRT
jgi:hypothetical protein